MNALAAGLLLLVGLHMILWLYKSKIRPRQRRKYVQHLKRKAIFITGCDSGFGFDMSMHCKHSLDMVVISCCHMKNSTLGRDKLISNGCYVIENFDVLCQESISKAREETDRILQEENSELWAVVNNAAVLVFGEAEWQTMSQISMQMNVNVVGVLGVTKAMLPLLRRSRGRIINVSSESARMPVACFSVYSASKAALEALTYGLRLELHKFNIKVTVITPPNVPDKTPLCARQEIFHREMLQNLSDEEKAAIGDFFQRSSKFICNLFSAPKPNEILTPKNNQFLETFTDALTEPDLKSNYTCKSQVRVLKDWIMSGLFSDYDEATRRNMVPLPDFK